MHCHLFKVTMDALAQENARLRQLLASHGINAADAQHVPSIVTNGEHNSACPQSTSPAYLTSNHGLTKEQVERYSRQLLLPAFGLAAQERLVNASVLIVGCGGLGSPAALYLTAAGVGRIGLVDHDVVDLSNLHRQIIHNEAKVGMHKAVSAAQACRQLNSLIKVVARLEGFRPNNAIEIVQQYDVVLDATDNPPTRYLISDACVALSKPLVSAAAVGTDGQLTVYNHGPDGPCYRCLFPESPAPENCSRCVDAGVLGPVPGVMGVLQAVEVIKLLGGVGDVLSRKMLLYDALQGRFTSVKLRGRRTECIACGDHPSITCDNLASYDYTAFTGQAPSDGPLPPVELIPDQERLTVEEFKNVLNQAANGGRSVPVLDVRPSTQVSVYSLPGSVHIPFEQLEKRMDELSQLSAQAKQLGGSDISGDKITDKACGNLIVLCRRGNNSQRVVTRLRDLNMANAIDVIGGVDEWVRQIQTDLPTL